MWSVITHLCSWTTAEIPGRREDQFIKFYCFGDARTFKLSLLNPLLFYSRSDFNDYIQIIDIAYSNKSENLQINLLQHD